jgi:hypothetical protein
MRRTASLALLLLPIAAACSVNVEGDDTTPGIAGQGAGNTRTYAAEGFTRIELAGGDDLDVRVGPGFSVRADGASELLDHVKIVREGDTLKVSRFNTRGWRWRGDDARISVTMPALAQVSVAGSGDVTVDRVAGQRFEARTAGSGSLNVAALQVEQATVSIAGSGDAKLAGTARQLGVNIAGSGDIDAGGLRASGADISIAGSGSVRAQVEGPAKVSIMGSGDVDLGPKAKCTVSKMGGGTVRCGG